jgi:serine/threonine protein kinase
LEYINLPSGLAVVIYADEGQNYLEYRRQPDEGKNSGSDRASVSSETTVGYNISERRRRKRQSGCDNFIMSCSGPAFDLCTFLRFAIKCTDCLEFVHRNNTIHGEIKLSAFQWTGEDSDRVKIWNFSPGSKSLENYLTSEGWRKTANNKETMDMLHNILIYMSPEQTGRMTYIPDHRSDIYSLGVVFYVLLTGRNPFDGGPLEILNSILSKKIPLIHEVQIEIPEVVSRIIERMTHQVCSVLFLILFFNQR